MENNEGKLIEQLLMNEVISEVKGNSEELTDLRYNLVKKTLKELLYAEICKESEAESIDKLLDCSKKPLHIKIRSNNEPSAYNFFKKGLAIMIALETLTMLDYIIEISFVISTKEGDKSHEKNIPVLKAGEKITMDTLTFIILLNTANQFSPGFAPGENAQTPIKAEFLSKENVTLSWNRDLLKEGGEVEIDVMSILKEVASNQP